MLSVRAFFLACLSSFLLTACGGGGGSGSSTTAPADTEAPLVPQTVSGTAVSQTQVDLSWSASTDVGGGIVAGYKVYRDGVLVTSVTSATSYSDTGLTANTAYSYTLSAFDNAVPANESAQSSPPITVTTPAVPPPTDTLAPTVPQNLAATVVSATQVNLGWDASTDAGGGVVAGYHIHRNGVQVASVAGTSYSDTGLTGNTLYSYAVSAFDDAVPANESAQSSPVNVTTPVPSDTLPPSVPQNLTATAASSTQVDLAWNVSTDLGGGAVAGYRVYRNGVLVTAVTVNSYSDTGLTANTLYSYSVSAYDDAVPPNESSQSSPVNVTTPVPPDTLPPSVPQNLTATAASSTQVNLSWNASTDAGGGVVAGYTVFRNGVEVTSVAGTSYNDTGLTANTTYSYTVLAFDDAVPANESAQSSAANVTTPAPPDTLPPSVPLNLSADAVEPTRVNLVWDASTDAGGGIVAGYKLYRDGALLVTVTTGTSHSDTTVSANTAYSYRVSAFDDAVPPNESALSSPAVNVTTPVDPGLPVSYNFTSTDVSAWSNVNDSGISSTWQVVSGKYRQSTDVADQDFGTPFDQSYKLGTYSYLPSLTALTGYSFSVDITPTADAPPRDMFDGQDVGVMFRYQNNNNYYRVSFSARESFARLEKKVAGVFTTLATNARGYLDGQTFNLMVNVSGDLIQVTRDGDPIFAVSDADLSNGSVALYCQDSVQFDNVLVDVSDPGPTLVVSTPLAYSVQVGNAVTASAAVTNMPGGGSVDFRFAGAACAAATESAPGSGFYTASCGSPVQGDYFLAGQGLIGSLRNNGGGVVASDENLRVGIQGDQYVSVGDSLTLGTFDLFSGDNQSQDNRIIGQQGFQARLEDLLTSARSYPNLVFNEGVGGDKTTETLTRINSILERHPGSNKMLLLLGTNDSGGGTPLSQAAFQSNMQSLVNTMTGQGKTVWVAKVPPVLPLASNATRNADIQGYNTAIDSLTSTQAGPDFFGFFYDNNGTPGTTSDDTDRVSLYDGDVHPNSLGVHIMADLWRNALTGATTEPFYLHRLCNRLVSAGCTAVSPTNHKQNLLQAGNVTYIDATFTLTSVPPALANGIWIQTANALAERNNTSASYIDFTVDRPVTVYVAYDAGAASVPNWLNPSMSSFVDAGLDIQTSDPSSPTLHVYSRSYTAGTVSLGGNLASGAGGANSNYLVVVVQ